MLEKNYHRLTETQVSQKISDFRPNHSTISALLPLAHKIAQGFNQPRPPLCTLTKSIDLTKVLNHSKQLIRAFTLFSQSNNTKRWLSACLKRRTASSHRHNFTLSPSFYARVGVTQGSCISPTPVIPNFFPTADWSTLGNSRGGGGGRGVDGGLPIVIWEMLWLTTTLHN